MNLYFLRPVAGFKTIYKGGLRTEATNGFPGRVNLSKFVLNLCPENKIVLHHSHHVRK